MGDGGRDPAVLPADPADPSDSPHRGRFCSHRSPSVAGSGGGEWLGTTWKGEWKR